MAEPCGRHPVPLPIVHPGPQRNDGHAGAPACSSPSPSGAVAPLDEVNLRGAEVLEVRVAPPRTVAREVWRAERPRHVPFRGRQTDKATQAGWRRGEFSEIPLNVEQFSVDTSGGERPAADD